MKYYLQNKTVDNILSARKLTPKFNLFILLSFLILSCNYSPLSAQPEIDLEVFATGFSGALDIAHAGDDRLFIVEQDGRIKIIDENGDVLSTPFLNIQAQVNSNGNEQGLLGMAFHPDYVNNGYFFVHYNKSNGDTRISRFSVSADNPNLANPDSELVILEADQPYSNHNGGCIKFGPDGYLYIGLGDGGSGGDPQGNGQNRQTFLGKMLRIDIDNGDPYSIPADNPFADEDFTLDEIWAIGLRNPWRFSFDRLTGDLWIGDVGQNEWEEIDFQAAESTGGENYGWRCYEGLVPYDNDPNECPDLSELTPPVVVYSNSFNSGCSVTGGFVYRGTAFPTFYGYYFYADYCSGKIWALIKDNNDDWVNTEIYNGANFQFSSFGEDVNGELYITGLDNARIYRMVKDCPDFIISGTLNNETCAGDMDGLIGLNLQSGATPFTVLWSTGETTDTITNLGSGDYSVTVTDANGCPYTKQFIIQNSSPDAPEVLVEVVTLSVAEDFETYQWYLDDEAIDATTYTFTAEVSGLYHVEVSSPEGCTVNSDTVFVNIVGLEELDLTDFSIHPNPFTENIRIKINPKKSGEYNMKIQSLDGKVLYESKEQISLGFEKSILLKGLDSGIYLFTLEKGQRQIIKKLVKQ